jgi:hypothetical protein
MTTEPHAEPEPGRRSPWPWMIAGAVVVIAAVVVTLVITATGAADENTAGKPHAAKPGYDLSTPEAAAKSLAAAAKTGSGDTLLGLACIGRPACVEEHAAGVSQSDLSVAQNTIRDGVFELAEHLKQAEFTKAVNGAEPGMKDVPYRTPEMKGDAYLTLTFVKSGDDWLYYSPMT